MTNDIKYCTNCKQRIGTLEHPVYDSVFDLPGSMFCSKACAQVYCRKVGLYLKPEELIAYKRGLERDLVRVGYVGLSEHGAWISAEAIGKRINEIDEVLKDGKNDND